MSIDRLDPGGGGREDATADDEDEDEEERQQTQGSQSGALPDRGDGHAGSGTDEPEEDEEEEEEAEDEPDQATAPPAESGALPTRDPGQAGATERPEQEPEETRDVTDRERPATEELARRASDGLPFTVARREETDEVRHRQDTVALTRGEGDVIFVDDDDFEVSGDSVRFTDDFVETVDQRLTQRAHAEQYDERREDLEDRLISEAGDQLPFTLVRRDDAAQVDGTGSDVQAVAGDDDVIFVDDDDITADDGQIVFTDEFREGIVERQRQQARAEFAREVGVGVDDVELRTERRHTRESLDTVGMEREEVEVFGLTEEAEQRLLREQLEEEHGDDTEIDVWREDGELLFDVGEDEEGSERGTAVGRWLEDQSDRWQSGAARVGDAARDNIPGTVDAGILLGTTAPIVQTQTQADSDQIEDLYRGDEEAVGDIVGAGVETAISVTDPAGITLATGDMAVSVRQENIEWAQYRRERQRELATSLDEEDTGLLSTAALAGDAVTGAGHVRRRGRQAGEAAVAGAAVGSAALFESPLETTAAVSGGGIASVAAPSAAVRGAGRLRRLDIPDRPATRFSQDDRGQLELTIQRERTEFESPLARQAEERLPAREEFGSRAEYRREVERMAERIAGEERTRGSDPWASRAEERLPPREEFPTQAAYERELRRMRERMRSEERGLGAEAVTAGLIAQGAVSPGGRGETTTAAVVDPADSSLEVDVVASGDGFEPGAGEEVETEAPVDSEGIIEPFAVAEDEADEAEVTTGLEETTPSVDTTEEITTGLEETTPSAQATEDITTGLEEGTGTQTGTTTDTTTFGRTTTAGQATAEVTTGLEAEAAATEAGITTAMETAAIDEQMLEMERGPSRGGPRIRRFGFDLDPSGQADVDATSFEDDEIFDNPVAEDPFGATDEAIEGLDEEGW